MTASPMTAFHPLVSIVIPARNEALDIAATLDRCLALDYEPKEIIVVDDSSDETPTIVAAYADRHVRLIHREVNRNGCCGARNLGMQMARGEIIIIFNADNRPRTDFIQRLLAHYRNGADYVIVRSTVLNTDCLWGRYVVAAGCAAPVGDPEWSEGFSCRSAAAAKVGYIPGDFPVPFCRDYLIGVALGRAGYVKHIDMTIPVEHVVPDTLRTFWQNRVWRGTFSSPFAYYLRHMPLWKVVAREALKAVRTVMAYLLIVPALWRAGRVARCTPAGWRELPNMFAAGFVADFATLTGNIKGLQRLVRTQQITLR